MLIHQADRDKRWIRLAAWWLKRKYNKNGKTDAIHDDMINCGNPVIRKLYKLIDASDFIKEKYQKNTMKELSELLLWIIYKDTAYRDPFFYVLKQALDMKEDIYDDVCKYYKDPADWYVNIWNDAKAKTQELKDKGEIADVPHSMSGAETYFVPRIQEDRLKQMDSLITKEKRKRGW